MVVGRLAAVNPAATTNTLLYRAAIEDTASADSMAVHYVGTNSGYAEEGTHSNAPCMFVSACHSFVVQPSFC